MRHRGRGRRLRGRARVRLQTRLFFWFGLSIFVTALTTGIVAHWGGGGEHRHWRERANLIQGFAGRRFAEVWDDADARGALVEDLAATFGLGVETRGPGAEGLERAGPVCRDPDYILDVRRPDRAGPVGAVAVCFGRDPDRAPRFLPVVLAALLTLWAMTGCLARRLSRPLRRLEQTARRFGDGQLDARADLSDRAPPEVRAVADAMHDMADRIAEQMAKQRALLATVSHEIRTPLGHMRILADLLRDAGGDPKTVDELERELVEADGLVDELLASARLDHVGLDPRPLDAGAIARRALERLGVDARRLDLPVDADLHLEGDATLLGRALANLVRNAETHGGGLVRMGAVPSPSAIRFEVDDAGQGFPHGEPHRWFAPFIQGARERIDSGRATPGAAASLEERTDPDRGATPGAAPSLEERTDSDRGVTPGAAASLEGRTDSGRAIPGAAASLEERTDSHRATYGLGLGLALAGRIARAHGGEATVEPGPGGGARVVLRVARRPPARSLYDG